MIEPLFRRIAHLARDRRGQTLVEYALILSFISVVAVATLMSLSPQVKGTFSTITSQLATASTAGSSGSGGGSGSSSGSGNRGG